MTEYQDLHDLCTQIKTTVEKQPTKDDMETIAESIALRALSNHERNCIPKRDYPELKQLMGSLQAQGKAYIALGSIMGVGVPAAYGLWKAFGG